MGRNSRNPKSGRKGGQKAGNKPGGQKPGRRSGRGKGRNEEPSFGRRGKKHHQGGGHQSSNKKLTGRVDKKAGKGFAFILSRDRSVPDAFVPRQAANELMNGDVVEYLVHRDGRRSTAEIIKIVDRAQTEIIGFASAREGRHAITALDGEIYFTPSAGKSYDRQWVVAKILEYPTQRDLGLVKITHSFGAHLLPEHDVLVAITRFNLPNVFPPGALQQADHAKAESMDEMQSPGKLRRDLRHLPFVTIDGEDAKDFDDAILVERADQGHILYVAIADVSFFVTEGSELDLAARKRGTSVYFPGTCIPMLPEQLSNDQCSLRPKEDRLALVAEIHYDRTGTSQKANFYEAVIKTAGRLTYNLVHAYFAEEPRVRAEWKAIKEPMENALALYEKLAKKRKERGVLEFELPESKIQVDEKGQPIRAVRAERHESHKLIEEFMIAANQEVARALKKASEPALYRVHEPPSPDSVEEVNNLMRTLGIGGTMKDASPRGFAQILIQTANVKGAQTLHKAILRLQRQAHYEPDPKGHFGLALDDYAHFTSPIRRYPDLVVHRALKQLIHKTKSSDKKDARLESYVALGAETSEAERQAMEAERFVVKRKQCWFMKERVGESFKGTISGVTPKGCFVEISDFAIDGFVPLDLLAGVYEYDESRLCLRRRPGHTTLSLGDEMQIRVESVSVVDGEITLAQE